MSWCTRAMMIVILIVSFGSAAFAASGGTYNFHSREEVDRTPLPGPSLVAATANILYIPARFGASIVGAELGGMTGFFLAGDSESARDVWDLFEGHNILTHDVVQGKERLRFGNYEHRILLITPVE